MARTMVRTGPNQCIPDTIINRRLRIPVSIDVPVRDAVDAGMPLYNWGPPGTKGSVWDALPPITLDHSEDLSVLVLGGEHLWTLNIDGTSWPKVKVKKNNGKTRTSLLTITSKMMCPSISLPAGPPVEGGTCLAAHKMTRGGLQDDPDQVCGGCYACEGNYRFPDPTISQMITLAWIRQQCLADETGVTLAEHLVRSIEHYADKTTLGNMNRRLIQEIGTWDRTERCIMVPCSIKEVRRSWKQAAIETPLTGLPWPDTRAMFESMDLADGQPAGFFRFQDSGDINIHRSAWRTYLKAIFIVAASIPAVFFWLPTRTWEFPVMLREVRRMMRENPLPNLVIRPSSNLADESAPAIRGLHAGTSVRSPGTRTMFADRKCPAYSGNGTSCMNEGCRGCWLEPTVSFQYKSH